MSRAVAAALLAMAHAGGDAPVWREGSWSDPSFEKREKARLEQRFGCKAKNLARAEAKRARRRQCADLVRARIPWATVAAALRGAR